jgi:hypothetical protein
VLAQDQAEDGLEDASVLPNDLDFTVVISKAILYPVRCLAGRDCCNCMVNDTVEFLVLFLPFAHYTWNVQSVTADGETLLVNDDVCVSQMQLITA